MTDHPPPPVPNDDPDDIVGQVVERAASKVAEATSQLTVTPPVFSRFESWAIVALIFFLLLFNIVLNVQTKNAAYSNKRKIEAACKLAGLSEGASQAPIVPVRVAECLD